MSFEERVAHYNACVALGINYMDWYNAAKATYDENNKPPEIDGDIDLGGGN